MLLPTRVLGLSILLAAAAFDVTERPPDPPSVPAPRHGTAQRSVRQGVYSAAQAERGARVYQSRCSTCHLPGQFTGGTFLQSWTGQTAAALFDAIRTTMPQENPGGLRRQDYADLLAYLFQLNGLPAGDAELKATDDALKQVVIEGPESNRDVPESAGQAAPAAGRRNHVNQGER